jgi:uncharacterized membrane protein
MRALIFTYLSILCSLLLADALWLGFVSKDSYVQAMGHLMREVVVIWPWIVFYLCYPLAILCLGILPVKDTDSVKLPVLRGAILGAAAYGTYNLTNYALLLDWSLAITLIDWLWGLMLTAFCTWVGCLIYMKTQANSQGSGALE